MIHLLPASNVTGTIHRGPLKAIEWFFSVFIECTGLIYLTRERASYSPPAGQSLHGETET